MSMQGRRSRGPGMGPGRGPDRPGGPFAPVEKAADFKGSIVKLLRYVRKFWGPMILVLALALVSTGISVVMPTIMGGITNEMVGAYTTMRDPTVNVMPSDGSALGGLMLLLIGLYLLSAALSYVQGFVMAGVTQKITYALRRDISQKIHRVPLGYFDRVTHGDVLSRITNDVDTVSQTLNQAVTQLVTSVVTVVGVLVMMLLISWQLTLLAVLIAPVSAVLASVIVGRSQKYFTQQQETLGEINGHVEEAFSGHAVIKVFGAEKRSVETFNKINEKLYRSAWMSQFLSGLMPPLMGFVGNLGYVAVCFIGGSLAVQGRLLVGDIQAFLQYLRQFTQPINQVAGIVNTLQSTAAAAERVFGFLEETEETPESASPTEMEEVRGAVAFDDVVFGYDPEKIIIKGLTANVQPGQKVAIVGPTGAGKTTIVNLLMRFYDVNGGAIRVDGVDVRELRRAELRGTFGMVLQDTWLFQGSIRENILYGKPDATHEELWTATRAAQVDHFINSMPGGIEMELNEEVSNISQGQKQLLTIARAMLADPPMLILDEATSSVDTRTEVLIQRAMGNLMRGRTSFIIAHRLSTIRDADLILVMRDGNIVEQGNHGELLRQGGFYAELYNSQFSAAG